ncbi:rod shape-determining protein MreD [Aurantibacter sp.]|uniref:rod shape-determining protein MreD n=1 Tax=Aurantibacter sp. TaxID=2807103 RepID=UPI0035C82C96
MNKVISQNIIRFIVLVLVQVGILNHINFLGDINPYLYVLFIILFPLRNNRLAFLIIVFFLGLSIDMFSDTGGIHAGASVFLAYIRPLITKFSFGTLNEFYSVKFNNIDFAKRLIYIVIIVFIHHLMMFSLEYFSFTHIITILKHTLLSGLFTTILILLTTTIFSNNSK